MYKKGVFTLSIVIILISSSIAFAHFYTSPYYILTKAKIVISGGKANSANYSFAKVKIGNMFGGKAESAYYSLEASPIGKRIPPNPPTLNPVTSPTSNSTQTLNGTKDRATSIYINGYEVIPLDNEMAWSCDIALTEGDNTLIITTRDDSGLESESVYLVITLDTIPPFIIIDKPLDGTIVTTPQIDVTGTIDGVPFSQQEDLDFGLNLVSIEASDEAGNISYGSIELYQIREPIAPPESK